MFAPFFHCRSIGVDFGCLTRGASMRKSRRSPGELICASLTSGPGSRVGTCHIFPQVPTRKLSLGPPTPNVLTLPQSQTVIASILVPVDLQRVVEVAVSQVIHTALLSSSVAQAGSTTSPPSTTTNNETEALAPHPRTATSITVTHPSGK